MFRQDPGPCLICGAAHCSCGGGPILVELLPATAAARVIPVPLPPLAADAIQATLPPESFTSATYRGNRTKKKP
jgi:hypothetical protein